MLWVFFYIFNFMNIQKAIRLIAVLLLSLLVLFVAFYHLGGITIRLWDESRLAINALEMYQNGNYWVTTFGGKPDMWNTKPPLMIWLQVLCLHIFGVQDWALRIPSALAAIGTIATIFHFCYKRLRHFWLACCSVLVLATAQGFMVIHVARTGDFDALYIFFAVLACSACFDFVERKRNRSLYALFVYFGLSVLAKSVSGLIFIPGLFIYVLSQKSIGAFLKNKHTYFGLLLFLVISLSYYLVREQYNPGYIKAVYENELGGRFLKAAESHQLPWYWYWDNIREIEFQQWIYLLPIGLITAFYHRRTVQGRGILFAALLAFSYWLIISLAATKLKWYDAAIFPFLSVVVGYALWSMVYWIKKIPDFKVLRYGLYTVMGLAIVPIVYINAREITTTNDEQWTEELNNASYYIRDTYLREESAYALWVVDDGYGPQVLWYVTQAQLAGKPVRFADTSTLSVNDTVLTQQRPAMDYIRTHYIYKLLSDKDRILLVKIEGLKP